MAKNYVDAQPKTYFRLAVIATCLAAVVVMLGAFTRLSHAGLGCPDWPTCYGHLWVPVSAEDIAIANQNFVDTPVVEGKTWPEQFHRIVAASLGMLVLGLVVVAWRERHIGGRPYLHAYALCVLIVVQALFGMWTVTLKLWPQVVTSHLLGGFATLSLLWLLVQRLGGYRWQLGSMARLGAIKKLALFTLFVVIMQIILGGWMSANYAALACVDFPMCHGQWLPPMNFTQGFNFYQHIGPNYLGGMLESEARTAIHVAHRLGAVVTSLLVLILVFNLWWLRSPPAKRWCLMLLAVLLIQVSLGVTNVLAGIPLLIAVAHNAVGALLLLMVITVNHRLITLRHI